MKIKNWLSFHYPSESQNNVSECKSFETTWIVVMKSDDKILKINGIYLKKLKKYIFSFTRNKFVIST